MITRFRRGVRVMWADHIRLVVYGNGVASFENPTLEVEKVLVALGQGIPAVRVEQQAQMVGVNVRTLSRTLLQLRPHLITTSPERRNSNFQLRAAELNRGELEQGCSAAEISKKRKDWMILLSGADSGVRGLVPLLSIAGLRTKQSSRGFQTEEGATEGPSWQLSHRVGSVSEKLNQISVGFFQEQIDPDVYRHWLSRGQHHIAVVFDQAGTKVSRLVRPGKDRCLECDPDFQSPSGTSRATLYFQTKDTPMTFDDARSASWATTNTLNRILDWIDLDKAADTNLYFGQHQGTDDRTPIRCACLLDLFEGDSL